jgi:hypothetical protein
LIRSPNRFSPLKNPEGAAIQRNTVLDRMVELKKISGAEAGQAKLTKVNAHPRRLLQIQENYAMDAVQRDLNNILNQDQIDNGGLFVYTTLDPAVQSVAQQALERQLSKIEHQSNFRHPLKSSYQPPESGEDSSMPYLAGVIMRKANSIARWLRLIGRLALPSSPLFTHSRSPRGFCPGPPSATGQFSRAKSKALEIGRREIRMALTAVINLAPTD